MFSKIGPTPIPKASPQPWLLGTSEKSAVLAAEKRMPYTFGHFMSSQDGPAIVRDYKEGITKHDAKKVPQAIVARSEEHTSELQSRFDLVCRLLLEKKN